VQGEAELAAAVGVDVADLTPILKALVQARILQREEADAEVRYQLAHEYLIQEIGAWLDPRDLAAKQAQVLLQRQLISWRQNSDILIPEAALRQIHQHRELLRTLQEEEVELLLRSALAVDVDTAYWRGQAPAVAGRVTA